MFAAASSNTATVALLLDRGADTGATEHQGMTALMHAMRDHTATATATALLLDRGADLAAKSDTDTTALVHAAGGHTATLAQLDRGADVGAKSNTGWTALTIAAHVSHPAAVALLAFFGAEATDEERGEQPLLATLHGLCRLQIAAAFRFHSHARRALRSGTIAHDPTAAAAAAILAAAGSTASVTLPASPPSQPNQAMPWQPF